MKISKINKLIICLLGMLLSTSMHFVAAVPYEYVGVKVGESYSWVLSIDQNTLNKFNIDMEDRLDLINASFPIFGTLFSYGVNPKINFKLEILNYQISHRTSPPNLFFLASASVINPFEVEIIHLPYPCLIGLSSVNFL